MIASETNLNKIIVKDNKEELIDISKFDSRIKIILPDYIKDVLNKILIRKSVAIKLKKIQDSLPNNMFLVVTSGYRPIKVQDKIYQEFFNKFKKLMSEKNAREEARKIISPSDNIPPHSTGAAIDITIFKDNKPLNMGCSIPMKIDTNNPEIKLFPTKSNLITKEQKKNRKFLYDLMIKNDFVNLESEWWHYSYGDRYWALKKHKKYAIFDTMEYKYDN